MRNGELATVVDNDAYIAIGYAQEQGGIRMRTWKLQTGKYLLQSANESEYDLMERIEC
jgi:hypothetical protein